MCLTMYCMAVPRHLLRFEYQKVSCYVHKHNVIYAYNRTKPVCTDFHQLTNAEELYVQKFICAV